MTSRVDFWRWRFVEATIALVILAVAVQLTGAVQMRLRADVPAENWFTVNAIFVPDFKRGENPTLTYDRTIKEPFRGFWVIEVERQVEDGKFQVECSGSGINDYEVMDYIPQNQVTWEWLIGQRCKDIPPGSYRVRGSWKMRRTDWPDKQIVKYSNLFQIH
jgi:hypothetical protein